MMLNRFYVDDLIKRKDLINIKGLIYLTDGYGIFPKQKPRYRTAFVFIDDNYNETDVPSWALKIVLSNKDIARFWNEYKRG